MITAIDSSVLWAILKRESGHDKWLRALTPRSPMDRLALDGESGPAIHAVWEKLSIEWCQALDQVLLVTICVGQSPPMFSI